MLYSSSTKKIPIQNVQNIINVDVDHNMYMSTSDVYIQSDLRFRLLDRDVAGLSQIYIRNVFPRNKDASVQFFDFEIYKGTIEFSTDSIIDCSSAIMRSLFSQRLYLADSTRAYVHFTNREITDTSGNIYEGFNYNAMQPIIFDNEIYTENFYFFMTNVLSTSTLLPEYEFMLYPFELNNYRGIESYFEQKDNEVFNLYNSDYDSLTSAVYQYAVLNRPRFLFSPDHGETWYKYNTSTEVLEVVTEDNTNYFTYSEFITKSNTYSEYKIIETSKFSDIKTNARWQVLSNGYIYPIYVSQRYWIDKTDITESIEYNNTALGNSTVKIATI